MLLGIVMLFVGLLQFVADLASAFALGLLLQQQPSPPAALAIGYWLTTAGLVAFVGGMALWFGGMAWRGEDGAGWAVPCWMRPLLACLSPACGCLVLPFAVLLVLAPLQLSGAVHGLPPPCDAWYCAMRIIVVGSS